MQSEHGVGYVGTVSGILKIVEVVLTFFAVLLTSIDGWRSDLYEAFVIGLLACIAISLILLVFGLTAKFEVILNFQTFIHAACFIYALVVSSVLLSKNPGNVQKAGGAFGILSSLTYLGDAVLSFLIYRPFS